MSETPIYGLRDLVASNLDEAMHTVAPDEHMVWEITTVMVGTPMGSQPQGRIVISGPSPVLGTGSQIASAGMDLRELLEPTKALEVVRVLVEHLRRQRHELLNGPKTNGSGGLQLPGQSG